MITVTVRFVRANDRHLISNQKVWFVEAMNQGPRVRFSVHFGLVALISVSIQIVLSFSRTDLQDEDIP